MKISIFRKKNRYFTWKYWLIFALIFSGANNQCKNQSIFSGKISTFFSKNINFQKYIFLFLDFENFSTFFFFFFQNTFFFSGLWNFSNFFGLCHFELIFGKFAISEHFVKISGIGALFRLSLMSFGLWWFVSALG